MKLKNKFIVIFFSGLVCGILLGTSLLVMLVAYRIDSYKMDIVMLESTLNDRDTRLEKLEAILDAKEKSKYIVKNIEIRLDYDGDELDKFEVTKVISDKYKNLIGKEVESIDPEMSIEVVDKRILLFGNKRYRVTVKRLVITQKFIIWIKVDAED